MLTNLYSARPTWLDLAHKRLDEAVFAAYGWPNDLSAEEIFERLLAFGSLRFASPPSGTLCRECFANLERAK